MSFVFKLLLKFEGRNDVIGKVRTRVSGKLKKYHLEPGVRHRVVVEAPRGPHRGIEGAALCPEASESSKNSMPFPFPDTGAQQHGGACGPHPSLSLTLFSPWLPYRLLESPALDTRHSVARL